MRCLDELIKINDEAIRKAAEAPQTLASTIAHMRRWGAHRTMFFTEEGDSLYRVVVERVDE